MTINWDDQQFERKLREWGEKTGQNPPFTGIHPIARLFPPMASDEWDDFLAGVARSGITHEVMISESGDLADGLHRSTAWLHLELTDGWECPEAQRGLPCRVYADDRVEEVALAYNLGRRHLSASQRAAMAERMSRGSGPGRKLKTFSGFTVERACEQMRVSRPYVQKVRHIQQEDPLLADDIFRGFISVSDALATLVAQGKRHSVQAKHESRRSAEEVDRQNRAGWERGKDIAENEPGPPRQEFRSSVDRVGDALMWLVAQPGVVIPQDVLEEFEGKLR